MSTDVEPIVDTAELRERIRDMYREVAERPGGDFHFEIGRPVAERLGYPAAWLDAIPAAALASFAGVGHMLDLARIQPGESVLDLGSGSGTDAFIAAHLDRRERTRDRGRHDRTRSSPRHAACATRRASPSSCSSRA